MSSPWKAAPAAIETTRSAPAALGQLGQLRDGPCSPETTIWPGALMLASAIAPATEVVDLQSSLQLLLGEPDDGHHRAGVLRLDLRHQPAAQADELHAVLDRDRSRGDRGRVLAEAVAGHEVGAQAARARRVRQREGDREQRRLGDLGARQLHHRAFEAEPADREPRGGLGLGEVVLEVRLGAKQLGAHPDLLRSLSRIEEREAHTPLPSLSVSPATKLSSFAGESADAAVRFHAERLAREPAEHPARRRARGSGRRRRRSARGRTRPSARGSRSARRAPAAPRRRS